MRILGVDPGSLITGYGFIDFVNNRLKVLEAGTITPKKKDPLNYRIEHIYCCLAKLIDEYKPEVLVLEKIYSHHLHPATSNIIGHARGVICLLSAQKKISLIEHSVKRIRKAVVGNGNATKQQTRRMICHLLKIQEERLPIDASDALALAIGFTHIDGRGL